MVERDIGDWLYVRYLKAAAGTDQLFNAEIIDVMRAGLKLRLQENGAVVFMPARHILDNKDWLECNWDNGRVYLDKTEVVYELGQIIEVKLSEAVEETRSLIAKPAVALVLARRRKRRWPRVRQPIAVKRLRTLPPRQDKPRRVICSAREPAIVRALFLLRILPNPRPKPPPRGTVFTAMGGELSECFYEQHAMQPLCAPPLLSDILVKEK